MSERVLTWPHGAPLTFEAVDLDPAESRHGLKVLRLKVGDPVVLASPWGLAPAQVVKVDRKSLVLTVKVTGDLKAPNFSGPTLALPLIRPARFDWAVEKAVELGAKELWPLTVERGRVVNPGDRKLDRWRRLAEEARKQGARATPLEISQILAWPGFMEKAQSYLGPKIRLDPQGGPWPTLEAEPLIVMGPEGGFTDREALDLNDLGFQPVSLGPIVLRVETAALAALAQVAVIKGLNGPFKGGLAN
ncbi:MAG: 16S rRNA (uracil(1498)-N(3))-methyltransferase [Deltaproteobacteria bacterium]|nr:16S rRNA (uracil(1498)-N(3))-methyltransferase [Deltaproteobacteria bacterium]